MNASLARIMTKKLLSQKNSDSNDSSDSSKSIDSIKSNDISVFLLSFKNVWQNKFTKKILWQNIYGPNI